MGEGRSRGGGGWARHSDVDDAVSDGPGLMYASVLVFFLKQKSLKRKKINRKKLSE